MLGEGAEPQTTEACWQFSLAPLLLAGVQTRELLEACPDTGVEGRCGSRVVLGGDDSDRIDHLAKGRAVAQELQRDLGVWGLA